jgi:hypothetical protein
MTADFPTWLTVIAAVSVATGVACALVTAADLARRPQHMRVMNVVYPIDMLFGSVPWLIFYWRRRRAPRRGDHAHHATDEGARWVSTATSTSHCGAGCTLGDIIAEFSVAALPALAVAVGWRRFYDNEMYAAWIWDFALAFVIGIALQYFAIAPMRKGPRGAALRAALKADTVSIISWQVGMYGVMALIQLVILARAFGGPASVFSFEFWFAMQFAMIAGFACAYPVNAWLIRHGVKEAM